MLKKLEIHLQHLQNTLFYNNTHTIHHFRFKCDSGTGSFVPTVVSGSLSCTLIPFVTTCGAGVVPDYLFFLLHADGYTNIPILTKGAGTSVPFLAFEPFPQASPAYFPAHYPCGTSGQTLTGISNPRGRLLVR